MDLNNTTTPADEQDFAQTPPWLVQAIETWRGVKFELDVCAQPQTAKCDVFYSLQIGLDGLALPWAAVNWCNPPYSLITPWVNKAISEHGDTYMLIPDKPEVAWFRGAWARAREVWHMPFRVNFLRPDGSEFTDAKGRKQGPKFPVCLMVFSRGNVSGRPSVIDYVDLRSYIDTKVNKGV